MDATYYETIDSFVAATRTALFVRQADNLLLVRPDKTMAVNASAARILGELYNRDGRGAAQVLPGLSVSLGVELERLESDTGDLLAAVRAILNEDFSARPALRFGDFDRSLVKYPTLAEIALTYGCQNRCLFCYASSPYRESARRMMTTAEVERVMEEIFHRAHVPSLSFTGGEATLRKDLPELIRFGAGLGFRVNLITNGVRAADEAYARSLVDAGLASAQVSLEAGDAELHDQIAGRPGAFVKTVAGVHSLQKLGVHVHTNTTLCALNLDDAADVVRFVARDLGLETMSMNMVIRTGEALQPDGRPIGVTYTRVAERLPALLDVAEAEGVKLVWYSPIPYCIFNPALHGLGAKSCACVDGILSVDPAGDVLPCSSFEEGIGSILEHGIERVWAGRKARYWQNKKYVPPACNGCPDVDVCAGACPLYWDAASGFDELPGRTSNPRLVRRWQRARHNSGALGVEPAGPGARRE